MQIFTKLYICNLEKEDFFPPPFFRNIKIFKVIKKHKVIEKVIIKNFSFFFLLDSQKKTLPKITNLFYIVKKINNLLNQAFALKIK